MLKIIHRLEENIIALLLVGMTLLVFVETILRFGFGMGLMWSEELTLHLSAWMVLFGASYGLRVGAHIGVDFLVKKFSEETQRIIGLIMVAAALVYCILFMYGAWEYLGKIYKVGIELNDMSIKKWQAHSILLVGFLLIGIRLIEIGIRMWRYEQTMISMHDEAKEVLELQKEAVGGLK
ncbi:TRAP transporter small permease [Thiothrix litoralis]|jgi:C4-dicarboxylate transporter DctQ subunit|uniref:TRAP transporter small permease protein n=1 Tax=Thiothrix litoralis TaxID=2891210 RepID=A0ABX7WXC9_9GAMM|nr:TRAP transporter small permease [Thiothrix litoralis]QTR45585.1 TRAP transporter small permease [Thiothrix litoralis]